MKPSLLKIYAACSRYNIGHSCNEHDNHTSKDKALPERLDRRIQIALTKRRAQIFMGGVDSQDSTETNQATNPKDDS